MNFRTMLRLGVGAGALLLGTTSQASMLNLVPLPGGPNLSASFLSTTYDPTRSGDQPNLTVSGYTTAYGGGSVGLTDAGIFTLSARINPTTQILEFGDFTIEGDTTGDYVPEILLTGTLRPGQDGVTWGFLEQPNHNLFEFSYTVTGGGVRSDFEGWGTIGGIILDANFGSGDTAFSGDWQQPFNSSSSANGVIDVFTPIPEPKAFGFAAGLLLLAGVVLARRQRVDRRAVG